MPLLRDWMTEAVGISLDHKCPPQVKLFFKLEKKPCSSTLYNKVLLLRPFDIKIGQLLRHAIFLSQTSNFIVFGLTIPVIRYKDPFLVPRAFAFQLYCSLNELLSCKDNA